MNIFLTVGCGQKLLKHISLKSFREDIVYDKIRGIWLSLAIIWVCVLFT